MIVPPRVRVGWPCIFRANRNASVSELGGGASEQHNVSDIRGLADIPLRHSASKGRIYTLWGLLAEITSRSFREGGALVGVGVRPHGPKAQKLCSLLSCRGMRQIWRFEAVCGAGTPWGFVRESGAGRLRRPRYRCIEIVVDNSARFVLGWWNNSRRSV